MAMFPESPWRGLDEVVDLDRIVVIIVLRESDDAVFEIGCIMLFDFEGR